MVLRNEENYHATNQTDPEDIGVKLQRMDSDIAEEVIEIMTRENMPILIVNDSFVCRNIDADFLTEVMKRAYLKHVEKYFADELSIARALSTKAIAQSDIMMKVSANKAYPEAQEDILTYTLDKLDKQHVKRFWYYLHTQETELNTIIRINNNRMLNMLQKELTDKMITEELKEIHNC